MASVCELGGRFRRCGRAADYTCQFCGRSFCDLHRHRVEDYEAVCTRERCVAKDEDLKRHYGYKEAAARRNRTGHCAEDGCPQLHPGMTCSMCQALFCPQHIFERMYPVQDGGVIVNRPRSVCAWCWERRKIWRRR